MTEANCCGWAWKEEKIYMFFSPPKKGRRYLGCVAAPHQSVSRTNTHSSNLAWELAKAVCSCDENERIDSALLHASSAGSYSSLWIWTSTCERTGGKSTATCFSYLSQASSVLHNIDFQHLCIGYCNFSSRFNDHTVFMTRKIQERNDRNWTKWREMSCILKGCSITGK